MKVYLFLLADLLLIGLVTYFIVDPSKDFKIIEKQAVCLSTENNQKLCAKCFKRDSAELKNKAFKIETGEEISILNVEDQQEDLSCYDYLQMVKSQKDINNPKQIQFQSLSPIQQILTEIKGTLLANRQTKGNILQPKYSEFVIYKWGDFKGRNTTVLFPNYEQQTTINHFFFYAITFVFALVLVAWIADSTFLTELSTSVKISLVLIAILTQLFLLSINHQFCLILVRVLVLNLGLLRIKVNNFRVLTSIVVGLVVTYFEIIFPLYVVAVLALIYYYGRAQPQSKEIQIYIVALYTLMLFNHLYLYQKVYQLNDFRNLVIDLCLILMIPVGLFLLPNSKHFTPYQPVDPEIRSISLGGYEEQEPSTI